MRIVFFLAPLLVAPTLLAQPGYEITGPFPTPGYSTGQIGGPNIAVADFDEDGIPDLAVLTSGSNAVRLLRGDGAGGFSTLGNISVGPSPIALAVGDVDEDGHVDVVVCEPTASVVSIHLGSGLGTFTATLPVPFSESSTVALTDVNADGHLDLLVTLVGMLGPSSTGMVAVYPGTGLGTFPSQLGVFTGTGPGSVATGDFDEDGDVDLVVGCFGFVPLSVGGLYLHPGDGTGMFASIPGATSFGEYSRIAVDDFNGDGHLDVVGYGFSDVSCYDSYRILYGDGLGGLTVGASGSPDCGPMSFATGDIGGGPATDLVATNVGKLWLFFDGATAPFELSIGGQLGDAVTADFDGDGDLDIAVGDSSVGGVYLIGQPGGGLFRRGDVNDDGQVDIADPIAALDYLFGSAPLICGDTLDANDDGALDIADPILLLGALFGAATIPPPSPDCGPDPTDDPLSCGVITACP